MPLVSMGIMFDIIYPADIIARNQRPMLVISRVTG